MRRIAIPKFRTMTLLLAIALACAVTFGASPSGGPGLIPPVASVSLLRASVPSVPRAIKVSGGNGRATLHWVGPAHTNGSPVNAYLVWPYLGHTRLKAREFHSKKTTELVTGLTNHRKYTFRVAARNGVGIGPMSAASAAVWVGSPPAVRVLAAVVVGADQLELATPRQCSHEHRRKGVRHRRVRQLGRHSRGVARTRHKGHLLHRFRYVRELPFRLRQVPCLGTGRRQWLAGGEVARHPPALSAGADHDRTDADVRAEGL